MMKLHAYQRHFMPNPNPSYHFLRFSGLSYAAAERMDGANLASLSQQGVTIVSPETTIIRKGTTIGSGTTIWPNTIIWGKNISIGKNCDIGPLTQIMPATENEPVTIHDGVSLKNSTVSGGNVTLHQGTTIGPYAHIRTNTSIGSASHIGNFVELKNTTVGNHTNIGHLSYLGDASIGSNVNIGGMTATSNYNPIMGRSSDQAIRSQAKNKTVIGNNVSTGGMTILEAPVTIPDHTVIASRTYIPPRTSINPYSLVIETTRPSLTNGTLSIKPTWVSEQYKKYKVVN